MLVYRSPLVKDVTAMHGPVSQAILEAERVDFMWRRSVDDVDMMFGRGDFLLLRLSDLDNAPTVDPDEVRAVIDQAMEECFK